MCACVRELRDNSRRTMKQATEVELAFEIYLHFIKDITYTDVFTKGNYNC